MLCLVIHFDILHIGLQAYKRTFAKNVEGCRDGSGQKQQKLGVQMTGCR